MIENLAKMAFRLDNIRQWIISKSGAVAEWFKATVLKTVVPKGTGGSNPSCSVGFFISLSPSINLFLNLFIDIFRNLWYPNSFELAVC